MLHVLSDFHRKILIIQTCIFQVTASVTFSRNKLSTVKDKGKGKASSLDITPLTIPNSGTLQPRKWQLTGNDCSTAAHAVTAQSPR